MHLFLMCKTVFNFIYYNILCDFARSTQLETKRARITPRQVNTEISMILRLYKLSLSTLVLILLILLNMAEENFEQ